MSIEDYNALGLQPKEGQASNLNSGCVNSTEFHQSVLQTSFFFYRISDAHKKSC